MILEENVEEQIEHIMPLDIESSTNNSNNIYT